MLNASGYRCRSIDINWSISRYTDMQDSASLLDAHVVTTAKDLSILRDQGSTDRHTSLREALLRLFDGGNESGILFHFEECSN